VDDLDPLLLPPVDPDAKIDPDDAATSDPSPPLPSMPCSWWIRMTLDPPDTPVSAEDVRICLCLVLARLKDCQGAAVDRQPSQDAILASLLPQEGGDSARDTSSDTACSVQMFDAFTAKIWNENLAFPSTIGALHERIESLAPNAWSTFTALWQQSCGIEPPAKRETGEAIRRFRSDAPAEPYGKPDQALPPLPADAPLLEEGLHRELPSMPEQAAAFLLHVPRDPPAWRYCESPDERSQREQLENEGCWSG
jgi:hypothetical protein